MKKILIVDDNIGYASLLAMVLGDHGYDVQHAADATEAAEFLNSNKYDAMVIDQWLPNGTNGIDLIRKIRNSGDRTGIILLTCLLPWQVDEITRGLEIWSIVEKTKINEGNFVEKLEEAIVFSAATKETV